MAKELSDDAKYLRDSSPERQSLFKMLDAYWGEGDGHPAPEFIQDAAKLCGFPLSQ